MYTLRTINDGQDGEVTNQALGQTYKTVGRLDHPKKFRVLFNQVFNKNHVADADPSSDSDTAQTIGFVITEKGSPIPINQGEINYIMTESGRTFERINKTMN